MDGLSENPASPDGERILMVAMELVMALLCCLYAYPHIPSRILDDGGGTTVWFSVSSIQAFRLALLNLLHESSVIQVCLGVTSKADVVSILTWNILCSIDDLNRVMQWNLYKDDVPTSCQQMFETIVSVYRAIDMTLDPACFIANHKPALDIPTREFLLRVYQRYLLIRTNYHLPHNRSEHSGLLRFCSELMVEWMQPYFASCPLFLYPQGREILSRLGTC